MKIEFFGDSITDAGRKREDYPEGTEFGNGYVFLVNEKLKDHCEYTIVNKGTSGDTISLLLERYKNDVVKLEPDILTILIGINDIWRRIDNISYGCKVDEFIVKFTSLITAIKQDLKNTRIIVMEPFYLKGEATNNYLQLFSEILDYAKAIKHICIQENIEFIPLQKIINKKANELKDNSKVLFDGVHPTKIGAQIICDEWLKAFKESNL